MTRRRFIADDFTATTATLAGDQAYHLAHVLRAEVGQIFDVVAGGFLHRAEILSTSDKEVVFELHEELEADAALPLHLLLAIYKFDHLEWAIEKTTELGVKRITPILARRTEKHLAMASGKRVERWRRIALEAAKQSRRTDSPEVADPVNLSAALEQEESETRILLSETEQVASLSQVLKRVAEGVPVQDGKGSPSYALAIGPEGGWTSEEMVLFGLHQWQPATLGSRILRAETAAIAGTAIINAFLS